MTDFDFNDFGFTAIHEDQLEAVQESKAEVNSMTNAATDTQSKLDNLHSAISTLLMNLKNDPEKPYIYWPNRTSKIEDFERRLRSIYDGT